MLDALSVFSAVPVPAPVQLPVLPTSARRQKGRKPKQINPKP